MTFSFAKERARETRVWRKLPAADVDLVALLGLLGIAAAVASASVVAFRRRDLVA